MKLLTWNCNGALRNKINELDKFSADVVVIQECENPATSKDIIYRNWATNYFWIGENQNKGLAIFTNKSIQLSNNQWNTDGLKYFISCRVNNSFDLIAVWCHGDTPDYPYIGQFWKYLQLHKAKLENCILTGDFNSNSYWDKPLRTWNHSDVVRELEELKIKSFYHQYKHEGQGEESVATFYLQRSLSKPYHIDYVFGSELIGSRLKRLEVGNPEKWLGLSDHMPVFCELK